MASKRFLAVMVVLAALTTAALQAQYSGRSLYDRLGGDAGLRNIVDDWYSRLVADPVLADRFNGPDKVELKTRYLKFFIGLTGGPQPYRGPDLYTIHRHLRISDDEWQRTVRHLQNALIRYHVPQATIEEFMAKVSGLHQQIVYSKTPVTQPTVANTLYDRLGGAEGVKAIVGDYFDRLVNDPLTTDRFVGVDLNHVKSQVTRYISAKTGGPDSWQGTDLRSIHYRMKITSEEWDATVQHLRESLERNQTNEKAGEELMQLVQSLRDQIVHNPAHPQ